MADVSNTCTTVVLVNEEVSRHRDTSPSWLCSWPLLWGKMAWLRCSYQYQYYALLIKSKAEKLKTFDMRLGYISVRTPYSYMDLNIKSTNTN